LALAEIYDGGSRTRAARVGSVGLQTIRDWVVRFNACGPEGLIDAKAPGNTCKLNDSQREASANIVESGPTPAIHGVVRWRLKDLAMWVWEEFQISVSETTLRAGNGITIQSGCMPPWATGHRLRRCSGPPSPPGRLRHPDRLRRPGSC
jgi:transposase